MSQQRKTQSVFYFAQTIIAIAILMMVSSCVSEKWAGAATIGDYDIVVYGGTSGGVTAAVQGARMGKQVVLIEPSRHLGGLSSGGLGRTDSGNKAAIGGISKEFYRRLYREYHGNMKDSQWYFEPRVAEKVFNDLVKEANVPVLLGERLKLEKGVKKENGRITEIVMESGKVFRGKMFIDATYEGDLMACADVSYAIGREANGVYRETLNGVQTKNAIYHQFVKPVDPYVIPGKPSSGLLPCINPDGPGREGSGDAKIQAYCFRLCATDLPENRRPWPKPENYDEAQYELLLRNFEAGDLRKPWLKAMMPNRKTDSNNKYAVSTDYIGMNYEYPEGDYNTRERIIKQHEQYQKGLMWTLANHPRVPAEVREYFNTWGLAKDEFLDNDNWPHQLYIREARRMISDYVVTQHDCQGRAVAGDSVGLGAYGMDSHHTQRYVDKDGFVQNEGDVEVKCPSPYPISYRAIVPRKYECENLLVPVCVSSSHIAFGSIRMEPVFMILGQSSATAAVLAIDAQSSVQDVPYEQLKQRLLADKQVLQWKK